MSNAVLLVAAGRCLVNVGLPDHFINFIVRELLSAILRQNGQRLLVRLQITFASATVCALMALSSVRCAVLPESQLCSTAESPDGRLDFWSA